MIDPELQDLLPLYVTESRRRLEHLLELADNVTTAAATAEARRELHTLKGSSRMLKLSKIAELCHRGETLLQDSDDDDLAGRFTSLLDELCEAFEEVARYEDTAPPEPAPPEAPPARTGAVEGRPDGNDDDFPSDGLPAIGRPTVVRGDEDGELEATTEHRISVEAVDRLTGSMAAMRLLALGGRNAAGRLLELGQLAEEGVTEVHPRQVLAMLSSHLRQVATDLEGNQHRLLQHAEAQLKRLLDLQLQPLRPFLQSLARHARELARTLGKEVQVDLEGGEARLDQRIVNELRGAFVHLVRNCVDHGIEDPESRRAAGKRRRGRLRIAATSFGDRVEIVVSDDGAGVDPRRVLRAAHDRGWIDPTTSELDDAEILQLLFRTGFSTRQQVSEVSGRGVGLDAVAATVRQLGGDVWMRSEPGLGTSIFVEVPAARRGERVLVLRTGFNRLALPKSAVRSMHAAGPEHRLEGSGRGLVEIDGELLRLVSLAELVGAEASEHPVLLVLQVAGAKCALAAEVVESEEEVLIRPLVRAAGVPDFFSGMALLTSGEPVAVLSPRALTSQLFVVPEARPTAATPDRLHVLLVEDSLVTREMERRMLEEEGFVVTVTPGAEEALSLLGQEAYDCLVTDLEMPGMDGFELTRHVRDTQRLAQLPIIMVSTRDTPADRLAGLEAGADAYISKQSLDAHKLGSLIRRLGAGG